jgi:hypothetical protein
MTPADEQNQAHVADRHKEEKTFVWPRSGH